MKLVQGRLNGGHDGLSRWPRGEREAEPELEDDQEESIKAKLRGIRVEQGPARKRSGRAYQPFSFIVAGPIITSRP